MSGGNSITPEKCGSRQWQSDGLSLPLFNMSESIQRIIVGRALAGEHPRTPQQIISWLEETATGWNADPTPFVWGGKRKRRRDRARDRRHALGGSAAYSRRVLRSHRTLVSQ